MRQISTLFAGDGTMNTAQFLQQHQVWCEVLPHYETYTAQEMAQELHVPGRQVAKTVLLRSEGDGHYIVAVLPADMQIDLGKLSRVLGCNMSLASESEIANHCPDCEAGALPPFGSQYQMKTIVDESLASCDSIVFEGNTHHEAIRMRFQDFMDLEQPRMESFAVPIAQHA
jgi:Ala-tRNA(Pro) deacylase